MYFTLHAYSKLYKHIRDKPYQLEGKQLSLILIITSVIWERHKIDWSICTCIQSNVSESCFLCKLVYRDPPSFWSQLRIPYHYHAALYMYMYMVGPGQQYSTCSLTVFSGSMVIVQREGRILVAMSEGEQNLLVIASPPMPAVLEGGKGSFSALENAETRTFCRV